MSASAEALAPRFDDDATTCHAWIDDFDGFVALRVEWDALAARAPAANPFVSHRWLRTWWESFAGGARLRVLTIRRGGQLVGAAALMLVETKIYGVRVRVLQAMAGDHSPRFDILVDAEHDVEVYDAVWAALRPRAGEWDLLNLRDLPADSQTMREIEARAGVAGHATGRWAACRSPYVTVHGAWNRYFDSLGYNHKRNVGKATRRLERMAPLRLECVSHAREAMAAAVDGMRIEASAWKADAGTAMQSEPPLRRFYLSLAESFARAGKLRLWFLRSGDTRIAFAYALVDRGVIYVLKAGYDPDFARFSPYHVLCSLVLRDAFAAGLSEYDFLGNPEAWKMEWSRRTKQHYWLYVFARNPRAAWVYSLKFLVAPAVRKLRRLPMSRYINELLR